MEDTSSPYTTPIPKGLVRILLRIESIECEVENDAPDFVDPYKDNPKLRVSPEADVSDITDAFQKSYPLHINERKSKNGLMVWELEQEGIWFDIDRNQVKEIWLSEFHFHIESEKPRYLSYYIRDLGHCIEWLQTNEERQGVHSLSEFKKKFTPAPISKNDKYTGSDILKICDMLARAKQKIDLRTGKAMVKFNTEKGRLESLLKGMADKLGYRVEALDKDTIQKKEREGENVSHIISLK